MPPPKEVEKVTSRVIKLCDLWCGALSYSGMRRITWDGQDDVGLECSGFVWVDRHDQNRFGFAAAAAASCVGACFSMVQLTCGIGRDSIGSTHIFTEGRGGGMSFNIGYSRFSLLYVNIDIFL